MHNDFFNTDTGYPTPLGVSQVANGINFAVNVKNGKNVALRLFQADNPQVIWREIKLDPATHKSDNTWHICVALPLPILYLFLVDDLPTSMPELINPFGMLDPYCKEVYTTNRWGQNREYHPMGAASMENAFDWANVGVPNHKMSELIIYEMHVRGFTQHMSSQVNYPGSFLGVIEKIPHLKELGVNAVELLPIHEFDECEYKKMQPYTGQPLYNYWGYSTANFFAPMQRYASENTLGAAIREFKIMVKALHENGIEVILDVVYNHTGEGNERGPVYSWKGLNRREYYTLDSKGKYANYSGCGNTFNCNQQVAKDLILASMRYWVTEMHVDGFRFDLASILTRGIQGNPLTKVPLLEAIASDPVLSKVKLIAEPWDAAGLYQLGGVFSQLGWSEWNDRYRDSVRRFIRGGGNPGQFATRICGSQDLYGKKAPSCSLNFITAHDGFTLADLVSYNQKHNLANGENNQDGTNNNESWNCGAEGPTELKDVVAIRKRQIRNFHLALMLSRGVPMIVMGDEYAHTRLGNNNPWCQDNELNWFLWDKLKEREGFYRFYRLMIQFRKRKKVLSKDTFYGSQEIDWHGLEPLKPNWRGGERFIAYTIKDEVGGDLYVAFNANDKEVLVHFPTGKDWHWIVNTASPSPYDFREANEQTAVIASEYKMQPFSALLLEAR